jgi:Protein of unknown function (DUF1761)
VYNCAVLIIKGGNIMCPFVHANYLILGAAAVVSFIFGFLWYGPVFGKTWAKLIGKNLAECKPKPWALPLTALCTVLTTFVLAYILYIYKPYCPYGAAFFVWLGFYVPVLVGSVTWEGKPWKLFALNAAYNFLNLQIIATVLSIWQ